MSLTVALVGCAGIAQSHVDGYEHLDDVEVAATCDLVERRAEERAEEIGAFQDATPEAYADVGELLEARPDVEAVDVCTDHASHHAVAIRALEAGRHALVEKPLGITVTACRRIVDAAERNDRIVGVAEPARKQLSTRALAWALEEGLVGDPRMLFWLSAEERLREWGWRDRKLEAGGGWVFDGGVHDVDRWRGLLGEVEEVYAVTEQFEPHRYESFGGQAPYAFGHEFEWPPGPDREGAVEATVEDTSFATLRFENGTVGQWLYSCAAPAKTFDQRLLYGSRGAVDFRAEELRSRTERLDFETVGERYLATLDGRRREEQFPAGLDRAKGNVIGDFADAVLDGGRPELDGREGLRDVAVPMAVYESAELGRPVSVEAVERGDVDAYQSEIDHALGI